MKAIACAILALVPTTLIIADHDLMVPAAYLCGIAIGWTVVFLVKGH